MFFPQEEFLRLCISGPWLIQPVWNGQSKSVGAGARVAFMTPLCTGMHRPSISKHNWLHMLILKFLGATALKMVPIFIVCPSSGSSSWVWSPVSAVLPISSSLPLSLSWDGSFKSHSKTLRRRAQKSQGRLSSRLHRSLLKTSPEPPKLSKSCLKMVLGARPNKRMEQM